MFLFDVKSFLWVCSRFLLRVWASWLTYTYKCSYLLSDTTSVHSASGTGTYAGGAGVYAGTRIGRSGLAGSKMTIMGGSTATLLRGVAVRPPTVPRKATPKKEDNKVKEEKVRLQLLIYIQMHTKTQLCITLNLTFSKMSWSWDFKE